VLPPDAYTGGHIGPPLQHICILNRVVFPSEAKVLTSIRYLQANGSNGFAMQQKTVSFITHGWLICSTYMRSGVLMPIIASTRRNKTCAAR